MPSQRPYISVNIRRDWSHHFAWSDDRIRIVGLTPIGRATIQALKLNNAFLIEARKWWVEAGWHAPVD